MFTRQILFAAILVGSAADTYQTLKDTAPQMTSSIEAQKVAALENVEDLENDGKETNDPKEKDLVDDS